MKRSPLAKLGLAALAAALAVTGVALPAHAAAAAGTVTGHLTTSTGAPVPGAGVTVYQADTQEFLGAGRTEADGGYTVTDVASGPVKLEFHAGIIQWATGKTWFEDANRFTVPAGGTLTVDERLRPSGAVTGRLTNAAGEPVPGAEVNAIGEDLEGLQPYSYTDEDGRYAMRVPPGGYRMAFRIGAVEQWAYQQRDRDAAQVFSVAVDEQIVVDDSLLPTGSVSGRLVDSGGAPVFNASVTLHHNGSPAGGTSTGEDGSFSLDPVLAGDYTVSFQLENGATQWAYGKTNAADASVITVPAGANTEINESLLPSGTVAGRFTNASGAGLENVSVEARPVGQGEEPSSYQTSTDASGAYRLDGVPAGRYVVLFADYSHDRYQWAFGKTSSATADVITVTAGETTTVNDKRLPGGQLRVKATDAKSGAVVKKFCVNYFGASTGSGCTTTGQVTLKDLAPGDYELSVLPAEGVLYLRANATATVNSGKTTSLTTKLTKGGAIKTTITNRATGKPVADACLVARPLDDGALGDGGGLCTDSKGKVRTEVLPAGTYTLFARAPERGGLGHQWVGKTAGTGDQQAALKIKVTAGKVATGPAVKLDKAGTVTGTVTLAATGAPAVGGDVSYSAWGFHVGPSGSAELDDQGRYTLSGLGPYQWPLLFTAGGAPRQWSGGTANRFKAAKVQVKAGVTVTYNTALKAGSTISGKVTLTGGTIEAGSLVAFQSVTGDEVAIGDFSADGRYTMSIIAPGPVRIAYDVYTTDQRSIFGWYGGVDEAHATPVPVPASGEATLNITIP